jgi:hypothetical protein
MQFFLFSFFVGTTCFAGVVVNAKISQGGKASLVKQYYDGTNARLEFESSPGNAMALYYRGGSKLLALVDHAKKSYLEASESDLAKIGSVLSAFTPKGQPPSAPAALSFRKETGLHAVGAWKCTRYSVLNRSKKEGQLCVVPMDTVGLKREDLAPLLSLAKTIASLGFVPADQRGYLDTIQHAVKLGFLVESESFDSSGKSISKLTVEKIQKEAFTPATFGNPDGYSKNDLTSLLQKHWTAPSGK